MIQRQYEHGWSIINRHRFPIDHEQLAHGCGDLIGVAFDEFAEINAVNDARGLLHDSNAH